MAAAIASFPEQQAILTAALQLLYPAPLADPLPADGSKLLFIDAPAGRGKSYVLNCIEAYVWSKGEEVAASAHAGIAAADHYEGSTMHRLYGLPVGLSMHDTAETLRSTITRDSAQAARLRAATLLVLDEVATVHYLYLEVIDRLLRDLMHNDIPFGGKVVIAAGDFRQTTVVVVGGTREQVVRSSVKGFPLWYLFKPMALTVPVRNAADPELDRFCELVGIGAAPRCTRTGVPLTAAETALSVEVGGEHNILLPACLARRVHFFTDETEFLDYVHPFASLQDPNHASTAVQSAVIAGHNVVVDAHNAVYLEHLPGVLHTLTASETIPRDSDGVDADFITEDFLTALHEPGKPPHLLHLKANAYVTALRNMPLGSQVLNGTRMRILWVGRFVLKAAVMDKDGNTVVETLIPRVTFPITLPKSNIIVHRRQFPVKLSYASTIHKQQGKGCPAREGMDVCRPFFGHGTNYTAFTRAGHADRLALLVNQSDMVVSPDDGATMTVVLTNIVYPELLSNVALPSMSLLPQPAPVNPPPPPGPAMQELLQWQGYGQPGPLIGEVDGADAAAVMLPPNEPGDVDQGEGEL
jgi:ATP-dependent DNA helicase PIF1